MRSPALRPPGLLSPRLLPAGLPSLLLTGALFSALWASAFIAGKTALTRTDPLSLLAVRFALAGGLMLGWSLLRHGRGRFNRRLILDGLLLGVLGNALYLGLSFLGLARISPASTVLIVSTAPFLTTGFAVLLGGRRSWAQMVGALIGFAGIVIALAPDLHSGGYDPLGALLVLTGTACFALGTVLYRRRAAGHDPVTLNGCQNLAGALLLLPFAPDLGAPVRALAEPAFLLAFLHLVIMVSIIDFLIWLALVRRIGAAHAASFHLLNPIFGMILAALVFGTAIRPTDLAGTGVVILGLLVVSRDSLRVSVPHAPRATTPRKRSTA